MDFKHLNRFRTGGSGNNIELGIPPPRTPDGRIYRYSPNERAHPRHFVLGAQGETDVTPQMRARMKQDPRTKQTVCPYSGVVAPDDDFTHPDDIKAVIEIVRDAAVRDIEDALRDAFSSFNRTTSRRSGFLSVETKFIPGQTRPKPHFRRKVSIGVQN